jgi:hypothetical protein
VRKKKTKKPKAAAATAGAGEGNDDGDGNVTSPSHHRESVGVGGSSFSRAQHQVVESVNNNAASGGYSAAQTAVNDMMRRALEENQYSALGSVVDTDSSDEDEMDAVLVPTNASRRMDQMQQWWAKAHSEGRSVISTCTSNVESVSYPVSGMTAGGTDLSLVVPSVASSTAGVPGVVGISVEDSPPVEAAANASSSSLVGLNTTTQQTFTRLDRSVLNMAMKKRLRLEALKHATIQTSAGGQVHINVNAMVVQATARHQRQHDNYLKEKQQRQDTGHSMAAPPLSAADTPAIVHQSQGIAHGVGMGLASSSQPHHRHGPPSNHGNANHHPHQSGSLGHRLGPPNNNQYPKPTPVVIPSTAAVLAQCDLITLYNPEEQLGQERLKNASSQHDSAPTDDHECDAYAPTSGVIASAAGPPKRKKRKGGRKKKATTTVSAALGNHLATTTSAALEENGHFTTVSDEDVMGENGLDGDNSNHTRIATLHKMGIAQTSVITPDEVPVLLFPGVAGADGTIPLLAC